MALSDLVTAAVILAAAALLLYRSIARTRGGCHGCSGEGCGARRPPEGALVRLGRAGGGPPATTERRR